MDIEDRIRARIEAILINDEKNHAEITRMATEDEPLEADSFAGERNLYQRIINSYRSAVREVNKLLEENVGFLSSFSRIVENIKEKDDFQEICSQIVDCVLQDLGVEYCGVLFHEGSSALCLEGVREDRKFLRIHSESGLLGEEFEREMTRMAGESSECLNIEDVYMEPRFNAVDFPSVARSVLCLPITLRQLPVGFLILSHSLPKFFHDNHIRILKILGNMIAHLRMLHLSSTSALVSLPDAPPSPDALKKQDVFSLVLLDFEIKGALGRRVPLNKDTVCGIRNRLLGVLEGKESILFYEERELLVLLPGVSADFLPARIRCLREAFQQWKADQSDNLRATRMNLGFSACEGEDDLFRTLEIASLVMHPEPGEDPDIAAGNC